METKRLVITVIFLILIFPICVDAYSAETTHPAISKEIALLFNAMKSKHQLTQRQIDLILKGSTDEDYPETRTFRHFYDPVHNIGLKGLYPTSKEWASKDTSTSTNKYVWSKAIHEYLYGNKEQSFVILGHILHLLEDASVPDHTRNDAHPPFLNQSSPYESWASQVSTTTIQQYFNIDTITFFNISSIADLFDKMAEYSNKHFFSKDTIFDPSFESPQVVDYEYKELSDGKIYRFGIANLNNKRYYLVRVALKRNLLTGNYSEQYFLTDKDNIVMKNYWNLLSSEVAQMGREMIEQFFTEIDDLEKYIIQKKPITSITYANNNEKNSTDYKVVQIASSTPASSRINDIPNFQTVSLVPGYGGGMAEVKPNHFTKNTDVIANFSLSENLDTNASTTVPVLPVSSSTPLAVYIEPPPIITIGSTTLETTVSSSTNFFDNISSSTATTTGSNGSGDVNTDSSTVYWCGVWSTTSTCITNATSTEISITNTNTNAGVSTSTDVSTSTENIKYSVIVNGQPTGSSDSNQQIILQNDLNTIEVSGTKNGKKTNTGVTHIISEAYPLIINEIAWAGTTASGNAEWIELYNPTRYTISLSGVRLKATDDTPYIIVDGKIPAKGFFVLERADDSVLDSKADQIYGNEGPYFALNNNGDQLQLFASTILIDETPIGPWVGGSVSDHSSMERISPHQSGLLPTNWGSNNKLTINGADASGTPIIGTPGKRNSLNYLINGGSNIVNGQEITLNANNSPYIVPNMLTVYPGGTLNINAGVTVLFAGKTNSYFGGGIFVSGGKINVSGTKANPVTFDSLNGPLWNGLTIVGTSTDLIRSLKVSSANFGLYFDHASSTLNDVMVKGLGASQGLSFDKSLVQLNNVTISDISGQALVGYNTTITGDTVSIYGLLRKRASEAIDVSKSILNLNNISISAITGSGVVMYDGSVGMLKNISIANLHGTSGAAVEVFKNTHLNLLNTKINSFENYGLYILNNGQINASSTTIDNGQIGLQINDRLPSISQLYGAGMSFSSLNRALYVQAGGLVSLIGANFNNNTEGIFSERGTVTVSGSVFGTHASSAAEVASTTMEASSTPQIDARLNWWGDISGPWSNKNQSGQGAAVSEGVLYDPWLTEPLQSP